MGRGISHDDGWFIPPPIFFLFLTKRLRPQARVVGQPPHERRHLGRRQTGRTRKGYAASVSGKAANGCAVDGPREKIALAQNLHLRAGLLKTGVFRICADEDRRVFYRLAPGRSLARVLRRDCRSGADLGVIIERPVFLNSLALCLVVDGPGNGRMWASAPTGVAVTRTHRPFSNTVT